METEELIKDDLLKDVLRELQDSYDYIKTIGQGAQSKVYKLYHRHLKQNRALKIMNIRRSLMEESISDIKEEFSKRKRRFIKEAQSYLEINHPNIARIYDFRFLKDKAMDIEIPYIIMQYVEGENLSEFLKKQGSSLGLDRAIEIANGILDALDAIHQHQKKIVHRDLKPSNIMIEENTGNAILIDFGLAKDMTTENIHLTATGVPMGTPLYMSPEQFEDSKKVGKETDIYSFGIILYQMLTGEIPFKGSSLRELELAHSQEPVPDAKKKRPSLPDKINEIIKQAMEKDKKKRIGKAQHYKNELKEFLEKKEQPGNLPGKSIIQDQQKKSPRLKYYAAIFIVLISLFTILYLVFSGQKPIESPVTKKDEIKEQEKIKKPVVTVGDKYNKKIEFTPISSLPDNIYYDQRERFPYGSASKVKSLPVMWVAAILKEDTPVHDLETNKPAFTANFLDRFQVIGKSEKELKIKELENPSGRIGWVDMGDLLYLPFALKDNKTSVYQKVLFISNESQQDPGSTGLIEDIIFYKEPGESSVYKEIESRKLTFAYVYAWDNNSESDSHYVLLGDYPSPGNLLTDKEAFKNTFYGWCKIEKLFTWKTRKALIPNEKQKEKFYIFRSGPDLTNFYTNARRESVPNKNNLLAVDSYKLWKDTMWPFILCEKEKLRAGSQKYVKLICRVESHREEEKTYIMKYGYAKEYDPRSPKTPLFKEVYLFRKCELVKILRDLNMTIKLLKPGKVKTLWKKLVKSIYGEEYHPKRTLNDYAQMHDGITYKELSLLFGKTQEQINLMEFHELDEIERKIAAVKARLENLLNDSTNDRFFGPGDDLYIWLHENELP